MRPTASGRAWRTEFQNASAVWPDSVRPEASVIVPEIISGRRAPRRLERVVDREQRRLGVQRVEDRLDQQQVDAALEQPVDRFAVGGDQLVEADCAKPGSFTSGESEAVLFVGPSTPATKRGSPGCRACQSRTASRARRAAARLSSRASVSMP